MGGWGGVAGGLTGPTGASTEGRASDTCGRRVIVEFVSKALKLCRLDQGGELNGVFHRGTNM